MEWWGNSFAFGAAFDADAQAFMTAVEAADAQALEAATKTAMNDYVIALKAGNLWTNAAQLLVPAGPRTLAGGLIPLKGPAPTNVSFTSANHARKTGLTGNGTSTYLNSNILQNSLPAASHALAWHGNVTETTGDKTLIGAFNSSTNQQTTLLALSSWSGTGRALRSGTFTAGQFPVSTSTAAADCVIGTRTANNSATIYVNNTPVTNTGTVSPNMEARSLFWFAMNASGAPTSYTASRLAVGGIYAAGLNATQAAAFRAAATAYLSALATAIP